MPFTCHIGTVRAIALIAALVVQHVAWSQDRTETKAQRSSPVQTESESVGFARLDSASVSSGTLASFVSHDEFLTTDRSANSALPVMEGQLSERYESAPLDRSENRLFRNSIENGIGGPASAYPTLNLSGFLQMDTGWVYQDEENKAIVGEVSPSSGFRRVRLRADGNIQEATSYVIDLDFAASGHPSFRNVGLTFHDVPVFQDVELGLLKTPFGMDALTSGRELMFMERQIPFALVPFRQLMVGARGTSDEKAMSWGGAVYRMPTNSYGVYEGGSGGIAVAGRLTSVLFYEDQGARVLHIGGGYSVGSPGDGVVRYRIQPGFFTRDPGTDSDDPGTVPVFLDTGDIAANAFQLFNLEAGMNLGSMHVSSEMRWALVDQIGGPNLTFPGFYVQASYVLTGEYHRYSREHGVFQRVIPKRPLERGKRAGMGAWEAAVGYSMLDLNQKNIVGGRGDVLALGLNWYMTKNVKFQFNVLPGELSKPGFDDSNLAVSAMRVQVEF